MGAISLASSSNVLALYSTSSTQFPVRDGAGTRLSRPCLAPLQKSSHPLLRRFPPGTEIFNLNSTFAWRSAIGKSRRKRSRECQGPSTRYKAAFSSIRRSNRCPVLCGCNLISHMRPQKHLAFACSYLHMASVYLHLPHVQKHGVRNACAYVSRTLDWHAPSALLAAYNGLAAAFSFSSSSPHMSLVYSIAARAANSAHAQAHPQG